MKRGLLVALAAIMFITGVVLIAKSWSSSHSQPAATQPELEPETAERAETSPAPTPSKKAANIDGSVPVKLRFPSIKDAGKVVTVPVATRCNWVDEDGKKNEIEEKNRYLDPDRTKMEATCYATKRSKPYVLPGTWAKDVAVIAGHTMKQLKGDKRQIAFNPLRQWTRDRVMLRSGDAVEVYTKASQKIAKSCRLVYQVDKYWEIDKGRLAGADEVWGKKPMPNTLLLIGCKQRQGGPSLENIVWRAKLVGAAGCG